MKKKTRSRNLSRILQSPKRWNPLRSRKISPRTPLTASKTRRPTARSSSKPGALHSSTPPSKNQQIIRWTKLKKAEAPSSESAKTKISLLRQSQLNMTRKRSANKLSREMERRLCSRSYSHCHTNKHRYCPCERRRPLLTRRSRWLPRPPQPRRPCANLKTTREMAK